MWAVSLAWMRAHRPERHLARLRSTPSLSAFAPLLDGVAAQLATLEDAIRRESVFAVSRKKDMARPLIAMHVRWVNSLKAVPTVKIPTVVHVLRYWRIDGFTGSIEAAINRMSTAFKETA